ncbi:phenylacetic acid degradation operon negative regulatory protein PaaX [Pseudogracilibacillus auburnensis]|uniref:PaaX family transcriptional regulator n=1 Tax=Pseudogracilibacillus auburnensis TaxID=1494959 RepID=A0A2V3VYR1_9BACI|nr:phenylacetic acid degradation operon negative regulatory protein PaaX [Pseudogracilibacillus auburnensis]PXW85888.1 PaaX family transcriptional regulator [Pseudogracilibacillus auburnensis]
MDKNFSTRSMIFTIYGDYIRHYGNVIWIGSLIKLLEAFGHNEQAVRAAVSRMSKQGWLKSEKRGNKSYYFLTEQGVARMKEASKRIYKEPTPPWEGKWWILVYTIPEEKRHLRDKLREELVWSGFGLLSNSCWITPNDLEDEMTRMIKKYEIEDYVSYFQATYKGMQTNEELVKKCWDLDEINERYAQFIEQYSQKYVIDKSKINKNEISDSSCFVKSAWLVHQYRKFLFIDPSLPDELLPEKWLGDSATSLFKDYNNILSKPAKRFFESIFELGELIEQ